MEAYTSVLEVLVMQLPCATPPGSSPEAPTSCPSKNDSATAASRRPSNTPARCRTRGSERSRHQGGSTSDWLVGRLVGGSTDRRQAGRAIRRTSDEVARIAV